MNNFFIPVNIYELISAISSITVIFLTVYTFYLTKMSNKITLFSKGSGMNAWYGNNISIALKNETLHDISIIEIGLLYKDENNKYWDIKVSKFIEEPFIIKPFEIRKFSSEYYQRIQVNKMIRNIYLDDENIIFYFYVGRKLALIPNKLISYSKCRKIYNDSKRNVGTVFTNSVEYRGSRINVDLDVKYIIHINENGNNWKSFLMNNNGTIDGSINGHNGFTQLANCKSEKVIEEYFIKNFGIDRKKIWVEKIIHMLSEEN